MARKNKDLTEEQQNNAAGEEEQKESLGSKLLLVFVTLIVIALWLAIIALLIKLDLGGFGSEVLRPILKDVPVVSKILPEGGEAVPETEIDTQYMYESVEAAVAEIKRLEKLVDSEKEKNEKQKDVISELKDQVNDLSKYKEQQATFEKEKEKFYEEVVYTDNAPDINEYKQYYETIEPDNAAILYKQVVEQTDKDSKLADYVAAYSSMKPAAAAQIFNAMTDDLGLVSKILSNMSSAARGDIMAQMNQDTAAKVTEIMDPEIAQDVKERLAKEAASEAASGSN